MVKKNMVLIVMLGVIFATIFSFKSAGKYLVINEKPVKSDVIIFLSGGGIDRLEKAVELYKQGIAPIILISNGQEDHLYNEALEMGVPASSIILENKAESTTGSAIYSTELMVKHKFQSAIVVSSNYHMRRVKSNFERAVKGTGLKLRYCSSSDNRYEPDKWWETQENRVFTVSEYCKLIGNYFGFHGGNSKKILKAVLN